MGTDRVFNLVTVVEKEFCRKPYIEYVQQSILQHRVRHIDIKRVVKKIELLDVHHPADNFELIEHE